MVIAKKVCQSGFMRCRSPIASWLGRLAAIGCAAYVSGCLGGQSGGETEDDSAIHEPEAPEACACVAPDVHPIHARVTRLEGGCVELVVVELLDEPSTDQYTPLRVGDLFGGAQEPLCVGGPVVNEGDDVFAVFVRGSQDGVACPEYRACSTERCGDPDDLTTTTISNECAARQNKDPEVDCEPITISDQDALAEYDRCDTVCLEETREVCANHADATQLGGTVSLAPWDDGEISFYWAGEQRHEHYTALKAVDCSARHSALWTDYLDTRSNGQQPENSEHDVAAAPLEPPALPVCPLAPRE